MSFLPELFDRAGLQIPSGLSDWDDRVATWYDEYRGKFPDAYVDQVPVDLGVFLFDQIASRVVLAYAISAEPSKARDASRMRGFPDVNRTVRAELGASAFLADTGHFLGHANGGGLDINLFAHRRELNRGWSPEGKAFRTMETLVAKSPGTFFYHLARYDDESSVPAMLEYGVLVGGVEWRVGRFHNKTGDPGWPS